MLLAFFLLAGTAAYAEFTLQSQVYAWLSDRMDGLSAVAIILLTFFIAAGLGFRLIRFQGGSILRDLKAGRISPNTALRSPMVFLAGVFLVIPGYLSDVLAIICLFPPTAWLLKSGLAWVIKNKFPGSQGTFYGTSGFGQHDGPGARKDRGGFHDPDIIDVEAHDVTLKSLE